MNQQAKICVPVCARLAREIPEAFDRACEVADFVELRLDYLLESELANAPSVIRSLIETKRKPIILTLRPSEFGGARSIDIEERLSFREANIALFSEDVYWDIEHDLVLRIQNAERPWTWERTICSYHDFSGVPGDLENIYLILSRTPAAILKIAFRAHDAADCLSVFRLLERAKDEGRALIAIAMGEAGIMTRILGPSCGSFLTYGSLDDENTTAPGQLSASELRDVYRIHHIDEQTEIYGLVGRPVTHSLSPQVHNAGFAAAGLNAVYLPIEVAAVHTFLDQVFFPHGPESELNLRGLSVTAPHKTTMMDYCGNVDPFAKEIGAVNTIMIRGDDRRGYNTDAAGFISPLHAGFGSLKDASVAVVGAGGAARAALAALRIEHARPVLFSRNPDKAKAVAEQFQIECLPLAGANFKAFDIVVNATPLGTRGVLEQQTVATAEQLRGVQLAYDLVYNPLETRFMRAAQAAGCRTIGGLEMFLAQAAEQFRLWTGQEPDLEVMRRAAISRLAQLNCETSERKIQPADSI